MQIWPGTAYPLGATFDGTPRLRGRGQADDHLHIDIGYTVFDPAQEGS